MCNCTCNISKLSDEELINRFKESDKRNDELGQEIVHRGFKMTYIDDGRECLFAPVKITKEVVEVKEY